MLPDTFGTTQFLADAPDWVADWTGQRMDSKNPYVAGDEYMQWLRDRGRDPEKKLIIASDGLDVQSISLGPARLFRQARFKGDSSRAGASRTASRL